MYRYIIYTYTVHTHTCFSHLSFYIITTTCNNTQTRFGLGYSTCMGIFVCPRCLMFTQFFHLSCLCSHSSSIPATNMFHMKFAVAMHEAMPGSTAANLCLNWLRVGSCELAMPPKDCRYDDTTNKPTMWHIETKQLRHFLALCRICAGHCWTIRQTFNRQLAKVWR